jgi:isocitrate dehydrogenase
VQFFNNNDLNYKITDKEFPYSIESIINNDNFFIGKKNFHDHYETIDWKRSHGGNHNLKFNENSVLRHIFENGLAKTKYIGFAQYDMYFQPNSIKSILDAIENTDEELFFSAEVQNYEFCFFYTWQVEVSQHQ